MKRREFNQALAAIGFGMMAGAKALAQDPTTPEKLPKHVCKGKNECSASGGCKSGDAGCKGKNTCKGKGGCATVQKHECKGRNDCKGMGGCRAGSGGCAGKNSCKGKGGCAVPLKTK